MIMNRIVSLLAAQEVVIYKSCNVIIVGMKFITPFIFQIFHFTRCLQAPNMAKAPDNTVSQPFIIYLIVKKI